MSRSKAGVIAPAGEAKRNRQANADANNSVNLLSAWAIAPSGYHTVRFSQSGHSCFPYRERRCVRGSSAVPRRTQPGLSSMRHHPASWPRSCSYGRPFDLLANSLCNRGRADWKPLGQSQAAGESFCVLCEHPFSWEPPRGLLQPSWQSRPRASGRGRCSSDGLGDDQANIGDSSMVGARNASLVLHTMRNTASQRET
jgi:hypothetical protein